MSWNAEAMKVNCLAPVFHLSAKVLLAGLKIEYDTIDGDDYDVNSSSQALADDEADLGTVAETVMKVSLYVSSAINNC